MVDVFGNELMSTLIDSNAREGARPRDRVPDMATQSAQFEPVAWWWTRNKIGADLRKRYDVPKELPPKLRALVKKLDDGDLLFPGVSWQDDGDLCRGARGASSAAASYPLGAVSAARVAALSAVSAGARLAGAFRRVSCALARACMPCGPALSY
jgi:hypothetical protein